MLIENKCLGEKRKKKVKSFGFEHFSSFYLFYMNQQCSTVQIKADHNVDFLCRHTYFIFFLFLQQEKKQ